MLIPGRRYVDKILKTFTEIVIPICETFLPGSKHKGLNADGMANFDPVSFTLPRFSLNRLKPLCS